MIASQTQQFEDVEKALDFMAERYKSGIIDVFSCPPSCANFAKAVAASIQSENGPCPKLLGEGDGNGVSLTFLFEDKKVFYGICENEIDVFAFNRHHFGDALNDYNEIAGVPAR